MAPEGVDVEIDGRQLRLSNLDKVLYPEVGFTKGEVIDYYARIAPAMLPHIRERVLTFKRFPNGVDAPSFFEKRCPKHRPPWVPTAGGPGDGKGTIQYCELDERAALVWAGNMAALELHAPMAGAEDIETPRGDRLRSRSGRARDDRRVRAGRTAHPRPARQPVARGVREDVG